MSLLDRHIAFVEALRSAGLPVSLAEGLDAVSAIEALGIDRRETLRAAYAATLLKRQTHRTGFDQVFDLYFPAMVGDGHAAGAGEDPDPDQDPTGPGPGPGPGRDRRERTHRRRPAGAGRLPRAAGHRHGDG